MLKQNNGMKEIFSNNFFVTTFKSYHLLRENDPYSLNLLEEFWFYDFPKDSF